MSLRELNYNNIEQLEILLRLYLKARKNKL